MKSLAQRMKGAFAFGLVTTIGIAATWSQALGQCTPDCELTGPCGCDVPEPSSMMLMVTGVVGVLAGTAYHKIRNRK